MKIKIPFLKVPYFIVCGLLILSDGLYFEELLGFVLFVAAVYATARAIYVKKFFWAWVMGSMVVLVVPIFARPMYISDRPFFTATVYSLAWFFLSDFGIEFSLKAKNFYKTNSRSIKKIALCLLLGVTVVTLGLIYYAKTVLFEKKSISIEESYRSVSGFDPKNLVEVTTEEAEAYRRGRSPLMNWLRVM